MNETNDLHGFRGTLGCLKIRQANTPVAIDLQQVLEVLPDGVLVINEELRVLDANSEACRLLGCSAEWITGMALPRALGEEHPVCERVAASLADGTPVIANEVRLRNRHGHDCIADIAVSHLPERDTQKSGAVVTLRDRTLSRHLHDIAAQRDQLEAFGRIAAGIAHEVKNPLGGIRGAAELLEGWSSGERAREAAGLIVNEVDRISRLVDELMVFARGEDIATEQTNVHRVLDDVLDLLGVDPLARGVAIHRHYDPSIPELTADPGRLKQVFINLGRNALQAMTDGERALAVTTRMQLGRRTRVANGTVESNLEIRFEDTGTGIDAETLERLATPLFTTRPDGHGLGLAVARHWLMRHGGTLELQSEPGSGTTAIVTLPLRRSDKDSAAVLRKDATHR